jgi:hypothetical protein
MMITNTLQGFVCGRMVLMKPRVCAYTPSQQCPLDTGVDMTLEEFFDQP